MKPKNTICLWFDKDALEAARFYAANFPDSKVIAVHDAPSDYPGGKKGDVLTVEFTVLGIPCLGLNGGPAFQHSEAFSFQIATETQAETDRYWNAIVGNAGQESACGWCKDRWGLSWQSFLNFWPPELRRRAVCPNLLPDGLMRCPVLCKVRTPIRQEGLPMTIPKLWSCTLKTVGFRSRLLA
jgi:predicted 3-demethylubiquinone-9 3-methyltransferase (glyoxalase superfamily)